MRYSKNIASRCVVKITQQRYLGQMRMGDTPESIRERLEKHPPRSLRGRAVSVSDVLVLNQGGEVTAYYIEKDGFTVIAGLSVWVHPVR